VWHEPNGRAWAKDVGREPEGTMKPLIQESGFPRMRADMGLGGEAGCAQDEIQARARRIPFAVQYWNSERKRLGEPIRRVGLSRPEDSTDVRRASRERRTSAAPTPFRR